MPRTDRLPTQATPGALSNLKSIGTAAFLLAAVSTSSLAEPAPPRELLSFELHPGSDVIGGERYIPATNDDTFVDIAHRHAVGFEELRIANPTVDPWLPQADRPVLLPQRFVLPKTPRKGIVLNTAEMRLYYYPEAASAPVVTFPVSVGHGEWKTPIGETTIVSKVLDPDWYPPASIREEYLAEGIELPRIIPAGPENPLGRYALDLAFPGYLIHGTNRPYGIGMKVTHGCIRLHPNDIAYLFDKVKKGLSVTLVNQPYKAGWDDGVLYLEAHPTQTGDQVAEVDMEALLEVIDNATRHIPRFWVQWERAKEVAQLSDGIPHRIGKQIATPGPLAQLTQR